RWHRGPRCCGEPQHRHGRLHARGVVHHFSEHGSARSTQTFSSLTSRTFRAVQPAIPARLAARLLVALVASPGLMAARTGVRGVAGASPAPAVAEKVSPPTG